MSDSIEKIQDAFRLLWKKATNQPTDKALMSIPVSEAEDVDCILMRAIKELEDFRKQSIASELLEEKEG